MAQMLLFLLQFTFFSTMNCEEEVLMRRDIKHWSRAEKNQLLHAIYSMKSTPSQYDENWNSYDYYSYVHNVSFYYYQGYAHQNWGFLPWHRQFLYYLEKELQFFSGNSSLRLPYWNPEDEISTFHALYDTEFIGGDGNPINPKSGISCDKFQIDPRLLGNYLPSGTPFPPRNGANGTCLIRDINSDAAQLSLPAVGEWDALIDKQLPYDIYPYTNTSGSVTNKSFRVDLEGRFHGSLHTYCGGDVGRSTASPVDPVFFLLHNWIDLIWWKYQKKYGIYTFPEELLDIKLFESRINDGFFYFDSSVTADDVMDVGALGYDYDLMRAQSSESKAWHESDAFIYVCISIGSIAGSIIVSYVVFRKCKVKKKAYSQQQIETQSLLNV